MTIRRPLWDVYRAWCDVRWFAHAVENEPSAPTVGERPQWIVSAPGGAGAWNAEVTAIVPGERIAWQARADARVQHEGEVTFTRALRGVATEVRVVLRWARAGHSDVAVVPSRATDHPKRRLTAELRRFKQRLEAEVSDAAFGSRHGRALRRGSSNRDESVGAIP